MPESREFFSIPEVAARMGVSRIAIFKRVKKGQLAAIRIGRNWAIPAHAIGAPDAAQPTRAPAKATAQRTPPPPRPPTDRKTAPKADPLDEMGWD